MWAELCTPKVVGDDLDEHTETYADAYIALEKFHVPYPVYVAQTPKRERLLNQFVFALASAKERRAMERSQQDADMERQAQAAMQPPGRA